MTATMREYFRIIALSVIWTWLLIMYACAEDIVFNRVINLRQMNARPRRVTVSGFSSGGYLAQALFVAHSAKIRGAAVFSHTFYGCGNSDGDISSWYSHCTKNGNKSDSNEIDIEKLHQSISELNSSQLIDDPALLKNKRLYLYIGLRDQYFSLSQSLNIVPLFENYIRNPFKIKSRVQDAAHVMPTDKLNGSNCIEDSSNNNFIANCRFSGAYEALRFILSDDCQIRHPGKMLNLHVRPLIPFNQSEFLDGIENHRMDEIGYLYVPIRCINLVVPCFVHVFLHGCQTARGPEFIRNSGFLEVSEANGIILLFPQNNPTDFEGTPAEGCWDTFGSGGEYFATKAGPQIRAIWRMIKRVVGQNRYPTLYEVPTELPKSPFYDKK